MSLSKCKAKAGRAGFLWAGAALVLLVAPAMARAQTVPRSVSLQEAIELTLQHNPGVAQAAGSVRTSTAAEKSAFGAWLPTVSLSAGGSARPAAALPNSPDTFSLFGSPSAGVSAGVSASWDVYTGGRRSADQARAKAESLAAHSQLVSARAGTELLAQTAFFDELRAQELLAVAKARVDRAREVLAAAQRRFSVGSATRSDVLRAELELNTAQQTLLTEQTNQNTVRFVLGRLIGADGPVVARVEGPVEPTPLALEDSELMETIVSSAPVVLAAEGSARASDAGVTAARSRWLPSVQLSTDYGWGNNLFPTTTLGNPSWSMGLRLSYPLFDGFVRDEALERARVQEHVTTTQLSDTRRMVRSEAERALGQVKLAKDRIVLAEKAVEVGAEDLRVQQERYGLGVSTILDLLLSQTSLVEAETNLITARFDYQLARAELEALAGRKL